MCSIYHFCYVACTYNEIFIYLNMHIHPIGIMLDFVSLLAIELEYHGAQASL